MNFKIGDIVVDSGFVIGRIVEEKGTFKYELYPSFNFVYNRPFYFSRWISFSYDLVLANKKQKHLFLLKEYGNNL